MSETYIRVSARRPYKPWNGPWTTRTRWLDAYPNESGTESTIPVRIDAAVVRTSSVTRLSWLRYEFRNMEIDGPNVPADPWVGGQLGNRARRGPRMRADDAMARFGDLPCDNMVVLVRGRQNNIPRFNLFWADDIEVLTVYELVTSSGAVRSAFEVSTPTQLHRDDFPREPTPGVTRTQEQLVFGFTPQKFRLVTDFDEMRLGMRPAGVA